MAGGLCDAMLDGIECSGLFKCLTTVAVVSLFKTPVALGEAKAEGHIGEVVIPQRPCSFVSSFPVDFVHVRLLALDDLELYIYKF